MQSGGWPVNRRSPARESPAREQGRISRMLRDHPELRLLSYMTLVNMFGTGMFLATQVMFFTRVAGLTAGEVGLGLAVAGTCAVFAGVPLGRSADRLGPRRVLLVLLVTAGVGTAGYLVISSLVMFIVLVGVVNAVGQGSNAVRGALIAAVVPGAERVTVRAWLRTVANMGTAAGAAVAAVALQINSRGAYDVVIVADALTFLVTAAILVRLRIPEGALGGVPRQRAGVATPRRRRALADRPYLLVAALNGVIAAHSGVLEIGVPLWIAGSTNAPRWLISALLVVNTVMVVTLQVRASRGIDDPGQAAVALRRTGILLAVACVAFGLAQGLSVFPAVLVLLVAGAVYTVGELLSASAGWVLSYDLADPAAHGEYQGVFTSATAAGALVSPLLVTGTAIRYGMPGWLMLAGLFLAGGFACGPAARRAEAHVLAETDRVK